MKITVTLKVKLDVTAGAAESLTKTQAAYAVALNHTSQVAFEKRIFNSVALHHVTYQDVRALTCLPANLVCSARNVVAEAYKRDHTRRHRWKETAAIRYDARTLTVRINQQLATLTTPDGRIKAGLMLSEYHRQHLDGSWTLEPTATVSRKGKAWYLHLICTKDVPDSDGSDALGVDSGIVRVATTSTGKVFSGGRIKHVRQRRFRQRRSLQSARHKSRNQRRLLKRLAGKEKRAVDWLLWNVANGIVREAANAGAGVIVCEDLKGIRARIRVARKQRLIQHGWPFASLFQKIAHVASRQGIRTEFVDARNTSKTCHQCGHCDAANRQSQVRFVCVACGHQTNADYNAALNIRARRALRGCESVTTRQVSGPCAQGKESRLL